MADILILGGTGYAGRLIARYLLEFSEANVTIAARRGDQAQHFAEELNRKYSGHRAKAVHADAANADSLSSAFKGHRLALVAAPTTAHAAIVIRAALDVGVDYLDIQLSSPKTALLQSLAGEIEQNNKIFITEAGFHPGLPSVQIRYAATQLDRIETAISTGYLNFGKSLPYTEAVYELIDAFKNYQGQVFRNGQWTKPDSVDIRKFDFGSDIGWKRCYSMFFEELQLLPQMLPSLAETGFYVSESHWVNDWIIMPLTWMWLKILPHSVRPIGKLLWWGMGTFHKPPYRLELQVHASGLKNGRKINVRSIVTHTDGYELTAIPVVATLLQYLDGAFRKPGLWMMGHVVEPVRFMADLEAMGAHCSISSEPAE
ncbi:MAG: saccharopine dehydrogenase NADP-binding domain-containing protein [Candidatus Zhuqueibacterota bacterium]